MEDPLAALAALPGVPPAVAQARAAVDRLLAAPALRRSTPAVTAEALLRGARASAALEGADVPLAAVRDLVRDLVRDPPGAGGGADAGTADGRAAQVVSGALRAGAETGPLLAVWARAPLQALARLHLLVAAEVLPPASVGRPRPAGLAEDPLGLGPLPDPGQVGERLDGLARLLVTPTAAPALVVAAVVHGELLALRPFTWGNGLVARAASRLVLVGRGLDPKAVSLPDVGHLEVGRDQYAAAAGGYLRGAPAGVAGWIEHCAQAVQLGAREGLAVCEAVRRAG